METKEQKIERLKEEKHKLINAQRNLMTAIIEINKGYKFRIAQVEQELKELEDDGRNSKN